MAGIAPPRMKDVAKRAGVSQALVSRILNGDKLLSVKEETRTAVFKAVSELGYVPNATASALRTSKTNAFGLALKNITSPVFTEVIRGAQEAAAEIDCVLLLIDANAIENGSDRAAAILRGNRIDGLLIQGGYGRGEEKLVEFARNIPRVIVNSKGDGTVPGVYLQDDLASSIAATHLAELGHREIGLIGGENSGSARRRRDGYIAGLKGAGIEPDPRLMIEAGWDAPSGYRATIELFERIVPTGLIVANPGAAVGSIAALSALGLSIPDDVSVICVHDFWIAPYTVPALTTVELPLFELGRASVRQLAHGIAGDEVADLELTDPLPSLRLRSSTAPPRAAAVKVRKPAAPRDARQANRSSR